MELEVGEAHFRNILRGRIKGREVLGVFQHNLCIYFNILSTYRERCAGPIERFSNAKFLFLICISRGAATLQGQIRPSQGKRPILLGLQACHRPLEGLAGLYQQPWTKKAPRRASKGLTGQPWCLPRYSKA